MPLLFDCLDGRLLAIGVPEAEVVGMFGYLDSGERQIERRIPFDMSMINGQVEAARAQGLVGGYQGEMTGPQQIEPMAKSKFELCISCFF